MNVGQLLLLLSAVLFAIAGTFGIAAVYETWYVLHAAIFACLGGLFGFAGALIRVIGAGLSLRISIRKRE